LCAEKRDQRVENLYGRTQTSPADKRFADSGGWGWAAFLYDAASDTFTPATTAAMPPQGNDAKCGLACHTIVKNKDYVFTEYGKR